MMVRITTYAPGLAVAGLATLAAAYVSDHYGAPLTLMCLLFGLSMNFLSVDSRLEPGLTIASRTLLRWGIVLVAARVTFGQIAQLGPQALVSIVVIVALTLGCGVIAARRMGFSPAFGALCGGAVAICGASAAMAFASLLGDKRIQQAQLTLVLVGISACSAVAMALYPRHRPPPAFQRPAGRLHAGRLDPRRRPGAGRRLQLLAARRRDGRDRQADPRGPPRTGHGRGRPVPPQGSRTPRSRRLSCPGS
jgi:uncharacterized membrane protein YadS